MKNMTYVLQLLIAVVVFLTVVPLPAFAMFENLSPDDQVKYFNATLIFMVIVFWLIVNKVPWYGTIGFLVLFGWLAQQMWPDNYIWTTIVNVWNWMVDNTFIDPNAKL
jgi:hypothetical protein